MADKNNPLEKVSKIEAAQRQLQTAIKLFFKRGDAISVHALASNAHSILSDLGKIKGIQSMKSADWIRPEKYKEFINIIHEPQNFFKHANKNPDAILDFRPATTPYYILDALHILAILKGGLFHEANAFIMWYHIKHPGYIKDGVVNQFLDMSLKGISAENLEVFSAALENL